MLLLNYKNESFDISIAIELKTRIQETWDKKDNAKVGKVE